MNNILGLNQTFPIYNADGTAFHGLELKKSTSDSVVMSLGDKVTGDVYYIDNTLAVTMQEYIVLNGVKYTLVSPPTIVRDGMVTDNTQLKGMTKYSFVFYHPMYALGNFPFTDIAVTNDEKRYLSQNKTFSWIGNLFEMIAKLNANLRGKEWVVDTNIVQYEQDGETETDQWQKAMKISEVLTFDEQYVADVLKTTYETWEIPFTITSIKSGEAHYSEGKRFLIEFGLPSQEIYQQDGVTPFVFQFGQGVGLKNNSRTPKNNKIVTRIIGKGSENNIPYGYPQIIWYGNDTWEYTINNDKDNQNSYPIYKGVVGGRYVKLIKHPFTRTELMPSIYSQRLFNKVSPYAVRQIVPLPEYEMSLEQLYEKIDKLADETSDQITISALDVLKATIESVVAGGVDNYVEFGDAGSDQYEGWVRMTGYLISGSVEADGESAFFGYKFQNAFNDEAFYEDTSSQIVVNPSYDPDLELIDYYDAVDDAEHEYPNQINPLTPSVEIHQFEDIKPEFTEHELVDVLPYDDLMLKAITYDQFYANIDTMIANATSENEKERLLIVKQSIQGGQTYSDNGDEGGAYTWHWYMNYEEKFRTSPYFDHQKYVSSGQSFDYIVIKRGVTSIDVDWDDSMNDEGKYNQNYFVVQLPQLDFDLYACASITESMQINMRSGKCLGCTFEVYVDWDDYKKNFYDADGNFMPQGEQRDYTKYPDSSAGQIRLIVKKDVDTFGTLMPNRYQTVEGGDEFVILGISLPATYITNAEARLDEAMKEYMLENNVYYYEYPLKFDEYFFATNPNILEQVKNNNIVRFVYAGAENVLYIKQITVKYGYSPLPQWDITLTDDVEIVLNQIGQVTDDVSRMRVQVNELQKYYSENIIQEINNRLSKVVDDVCMGRITFQQGLNSVGSVIFHDYIGSPEFVSGLYAGKGWRIDNLGNAELESVRVRSFLEIVELLVNRMQAQEGDTVFSDNDQIEKVDKYIDETDQSVSYVLSFKEKYDGYVTSQAYGNILKGIINTLAAKQAGISTYTDQQAVETDGVNTYYTSWMRVIATHNTDNQLGVNQVRVVLYGDSETPANKNFEPCELMNVARQGCFLDPNEQGISAAESTSRRRRQSLFYISTSEGRIVKLVSVNKPKLENWNYGTTLGELPDFVKNYGNVRERLIEGRDYLYAQGVVVSDFIKVDINGAPVSTIVFCDEWVDGSMMENPTIGNGIYLKDEYNPTTQQYETHEVRHNGGRWQCLQHQPVISGGVATYYEPKWNSPYWRLVDGNDNLTIEFVSSKGYSFRRGNVDTVVTPHLFYGNVDITNEVAAEYWNWTRESESGKTVADESWDAQHTGLVTGIKTLHLTNNDMPQTWSSANKAIFTCTVSVNDGKTTRIVDNQIIS